ncbi:hypothetical protein CI610_02772 [invertebrate metagenome]|uniref:C3H1-type domain-containing protein n=1 Tax=invertebrate metagenome TaxID=1711999 RepID=A0A2H9T513_9ZZZZ
MDLRIILLSLTIFYGEAYGVNIIHTPNINPKAYAFIPEDKYEWQIVSSWLNPLKITIFSHTVFQIGFIPWDHYNQTPLFPAIFMQQENGNLLSDNTSQKSIQQPFTLSRKHQNTSFCRDFLNNKCIRNDCIYQHKEACRDALRGNCQRTHCKYLHPSDYNIARCHKCHMFGHFPEKCQSIIQSVH